MDLITRMLTPAAINRISPEDALNHPFFLSEENNNTT
jgi:hypothetical protein